MRKWLIGSVAICALIGATIPAKAHLTGAFADYLAVVYDETTIADLKTELSDTKSEIEALQPKFDELAQQFNDKQSIAIDQLLGYSDVGLDTWYTMLSDNRDMTDLLGDQWVMQKAIDHYIDSVNDLYVLYHEVRLQQQTLQGHEQLLKVIQKSLERRQAYLNENAGLELEQIANYLDIDWTSEMETPLFNSIKRDNQYIQDHLSSLLDTKQGLKIDEQKLNKFSNAHYFMRADHVYVSFENNKEHVILIGQVLQNDQGTKAELIFEAGYYNGFFLPAENLNEIPALSFDYQQLQTLKGIETPYLKQQNGAIEIKTK